MLNVETDEREIRLSVDNLGPRIPADTLEAIFEPFERRESRSQGLRLGLFIAAEVVRAHGGHLAVRSDDGLTRFEATFPVL